MNQAEKMKILRIVKESKMSVKDTLKPLGVSYASFYRWNKQYIEGGYKALARKHNSTKRYWNQLTQQQQERIVELSKEKPNLSNRELAWFITNSESWFVSESTVYRILKKQKNFTFISISAKSFKRKKSVHKSLIQTGAVNQLWKTDFTYIDLKKWGCYILFTVMDDYSRYIINWHLYPASENFNESKIIWQTLQIAGLTEAQWPDILNENGQASISKYLWEYCENQKIKNIDYKYNPTLQEKYGRYNHLKKRLVLNAYYAKYDVEALIKEWVDYYNQHYYHELLNNLTPADIFFGRTRKKQKLNGIPKY